MIKRALSLLLLLSALPVFAQFADDVAFPLTNTRYGPAGTPARPVIASNGNELLLVWWTPASIRVTKAVPGVEKPRVGRPVLPAETGQFDEPAVVWTGSRFLVASNDGNAIVGRFLFANGEPAGEQFTIMSNAYGPQLASNGSRILMLYRPREFGGDVRAVSLTSTGVVSGNDQLVTVGDYTQAVRWYGVASNGSGFAAIVGEADGVGINTFKSDGTLGTHFDAVGAVPFGTRAQRHVAIAASSSNYLAVWSEAGQPLRGALVDANGVITPTTPIDSASKPTDTFEAPAIAWNGTRFDVAWIFGGAIKSAHITPAGIISQGTVTAARGFAWTSLASGGGNTLLAWSERKAIFPPVEPNTEGVVPNPFGGIVNVRGLGFQRFVGEGYIAGYSAAEQILIAASSGIDSTLVVWIERTAEGESTWYGVRGRDGSWVEQKIAPEGRVAFVATDGRNFMIVMNAPTGALTMHIASDGAQLESLAITGLTPTGLASNGTHYAVIGYDSALNTIATLFTPTTITVKNLLVRAVDSGKVGDPVITSDGREFLVAWLTRGGCQPPCPVNLQFLRLDNALARIDATALSFPVETASDLDAAWNGSNYGVAVINDGQIRLVSIPTRGQPTSMLNVYEATGSMERDVSIESIGGRFAVAWREPATETNRGVLVSNAGVVESRLTLDTGHMASTGPILLAAPGGLTATVASITNDGDPHHGAERVMMRIDAPTPLPGAPRLQASVVGDAIRLEWTLPSGLVHGYRIEYRLNDGLWNELEGWLPPSERSASLVLPRNAVYWFRVRAWSDAGTGPYSNETLIVLGGKLRAVR